MHFRPFLTGLALCLLIAGPLAPLTHAYAGTEPSRANPADTPDNSSHPMADLVVIIKSERVLYLYSKGLIIGQYPIALGLDPVGTKHRRGDDKTPVGSYTLDWRNPDSIFHLSIHISYPNAHDRAYAKAHHESPGDNIMIHGQPDYDSRRRTGDWTHGCIAVSNAAMDQIWQRVPDGTPIHIYP